MFVNVMKNGSSSMAKVIKQVVIDQHQSNFWFTIVRDPFERFVSTMEFVKETSGLDVNGVGECFMKFPDNSPQKLFDQFCYFTPQKLFIQWYQSRFDMKFYSIENLEPLRRDLNNLSSKEVVIPHVNKTGRSASVQRWIEGNRNFIDNFLEQDYEWYNSLEIEK